MKAQQIMLRPVVTLQEVTNLKEVVKRMVDHDLRRIPVMRGRMLAKLNNSLATLPITGEHSDLRRTRPLLRRRRSTSYFPMQQSGALT